MTIRILRRLAVMEKTGLSSRTMDRKEAAGEFPKRVQLGNGRSAGARTK
jgi:predicted DNA-binding transcriptional regulator AlpA